MVQYYWDMWKRYSHILTPITEFLVGKKGEKVERTRDIDKAFLDLKIIISEETLLNDPYRKIIFTIHTHDSDKYMAKCHQSKQ